MGLLDQVLSQVIGGMAGGAASRAPQGFPPPGGGAPQGGIGLPGNLGALLNGPGGKVAMAILALLASKHLKDGAGGYGSILHDMFAGGPGGSAPSRDPNPGPGGGSGQDGGDEEAEGFGDPPASSGAPPYGQAPGGQGAGSGRSGGFLNEIGGLLDGPGERGAAPSAVGGSAGGSFGGGALGGALGGGLNDLIDRFRQNGHGGPVESWIGSGPNQTIAPHQLESALGRGQVDDLARQTGLGRDELLGQLSSVLPQVIDRLTPHGRPPSPDESSRWI